MGQGAGIIVGYFSTSSIVSTLSPLLFHHFSEPATKEL
jgi:hypothetical protein